MGGDASIERWDDCVKEQDMRPTAIEQDFGY